MFIAVFAVHAAVLTFFVNIEPRSGEFHYTVELMGMFLPIFTTWLTIAPPYMSTRLMLSRSFGRFAAACAALLFAFAVSLVIPAALALFGRVDVAHILGAYLGLMLLGTAYLSLGMYLRLLLGNTAVLGIVSFVLSLCLFFTLFEHRFSSFVMGLLHLDDIIFFASFCVFFTVVSVFAAKGSTRGIAVSRAILLGIMLVSFNMFVSSHSLSVDLTAKRIFSLSPRTLQTLDELDEPIRIYAAFPPSRSDTHIEISREILRGYSRHRNVHLSFASPWRLSCHGFEDIALGSIVVARHDTFKIIPSEKLFLTTFDEYELQINITSLNLEAELTNAILYCTADEKLVAAKMSAYSEHPLPQAFIDTLVSANYDVIDISAAEDEIPAEVSVLLVTAPARDFNAAEAARLDSFLERGGSAVFAVDADSAAYPHINTILAGLGVELGGRLIIETHDYLYSGSNILATTLALGVDGAVRRVLMPAAQAVYLYDGYNADAAAGGIAVTSPYAFEQAFPWDTPDAGYSGVFTLAAKAETDRGGSTARTIVLGSSLIFDETANMFSGGENYRFLVDAINWTQHAENFVDIAPAPLNQARLSINNTQGVILLTLLGGVLPAVIILAGLRRAR